MVVWRWGSVAQPRSEVFGYGALTFAFKSTLFGCKRRFCCTPRFWWNGDAVDEVVQPGVGVKFVLVLGSKALGFDDNNAFHRYAMVRQCEQTVFHPLREARGNDIKAQMNRATYFIDVLPPSPLRPNGGDFYF